MTSLNIVNLKGLKTGTLKLPETFAARPNPGLIAQAVHVYQNNQRRGLAKVITRGQSGRTTAKVYRQKHTGRARHGSRSAPIFVGGGVAHGPTGTQNYASALPRKMSRLATLSAISVKLSQNKILIVDGFDKIEPKAKAGRKVLEALQIVNRQTLVATPGQSGALKRSLQNFPNVSVVPVSNLNTYSVLASDYLIFTPQSVGLLGKPQPVSPPPPAKSSTKTKAKPKTKKR